MDDPRYTFAIRTPAKQARADRVRRLKRLSIVVGIVAALLAPGTVAEVDASACTHVWVC